MKKLSVLFIVGAMLVFAPSCSNFEKINTNPNQPATVPSGLLMADIIRIAMNNMYSTFVGGDMGACWAQQWAKVQYNDEALYEPRLTVIQSTWQSLYADVANDSEVMRRLAEEEGNSNMEGVALVLKAWAFATLTDIYGHVPYTEALRSADAIFTPVYDEEEVVYDGVLAMLDEANSKFSADGGVINPTTDILYGGDWSKWQKMANSLKFRALMRISGVRSVGAELQDIVNNREVFESMADEAALVYLELAPNANPIYETIDFGNRGEFKINEVMVELLRNLGPGEYDPRLPIYAETNDVGDYRGKPAGIEDVPNPDWNYTNVSSIGEFYLNPELPGHFMSFSELMFLMAEAVERGLITGSANTYYNAAITSNMVYNGIPADAVPAYLAHESVDLDATSNRLRRISEQKWIALYCQGIEAWTEWRRTGYPELEPAQEAVLNEIPSRWIYPAIEQSINKTAYEEASSAMGGDALTSKLWWMD